MSLIFGLDINLFVFNKARKPSDVFAYVCSIAMCLPMSVQMQPSLCASPCLGMQGMEYLTW